MTNSEKMAELLIDSAWKSLEYTQQRSDRTEDKANNLIVFSGVLMTINVAIIVEVIKYTFISTLLFIEMILLIKCVWYAYCTIKLKKQNLLDMVGTIRKLDATDHVQATGDIAITIANRQLELLSLSKERSDSLQTSMKWFALALGFLIVIVTFYVLSVSVPYFEVQLQRLFPNP